MIRKTSQSLILSLCCIASSGCMLDNVLNTLSHDNRIIPPDILYPDNPANKIHSNQPIRKRYAVYKKHKTAMPKGYLVGGNSQPLPSQADAYRWIKSQRPETYTIELTNSTDAAQVAAVLHQAPSGEHTAEVGIERGKIMHYRGLYGSFQTQRAAKDALSTMPKELQKNASILPWSSIQGSIKDSGRF